MERAEARGRGGGPAVPDKDGPGTPNPTPEANRALSNYHNLTMTEAGKLIENEADRPNMKPEDIKDLRWGQTRCTRDGAASSSRAF